MAISDRINDWVEGRREAWGEALGNFLLGTIAKGGTKLLEDFEPGAIDGVKDALQKLIDDPNTPDDFKKVLARTMVPGNPILLVLGVLVLVFYLTGGLAAALAPVWRNLGYKVDRGAESFRLDPQTITSAWLRDKLGYEWLWDDLEELGWNDKKIAVAKELAKIIPPLADMVRFADFSAFDPEVIEKWREFYDAPGWIIDPFELIGITNEAPRDWANKYWFSHYVQPGRFELGEMYRRGLLGKPLVGQDEVGGVETEGEAEETIKLAYRTMAYSTFWQDRLLQLVREVPTRVDVRRWWDMRTIDEEELRSIYQRRGYFGKDLENYVLWTKVYVAFPDLMARWSNGWITADEVRSELTELGMPAARVEEMIQTKIKAAKPGRTAAERDLTATDIIMGVKKGVISRAEGIELLGDLGYDEDEAAFKIDVRITTEGGSPETFEEYKDLTQKWRRAVGKEAKPVSEELKAAAAEVVRLTGEVDNLREQLEQFNLETLEVEPVPEDIILRRTELEAMVANAERELALAKSRYDNLLTQWRHAVG